MTNQIVIFFTGGTITMKIDPESNSVKPGLSPNEMLSTIQGIEQFAHLRVIHFSDLAGPQMTCDVMHRLSRQINKQLEHPEVKAVVVTHGTDTLEETAYFLELTINSEKPVVVVGAMRSSSELGFDGPSNLAAGIVTAGAEESRNRGVLVVLNNEINAASEVTKTDTVSLHTFKSPAFGPLGIIDNNQAIYYRNITSKQYIGLSKVLPDVRVLKTYADMDNELIDFCANLPVDGLVIEALGRGNVPPSVAKALQRTIEKDIPVVVCSRCSTGRVLDTYGYEGAGRNLREMGAILGGDLPGHKARIKLMLALGKSIDRDEIKDLFERGLYDN